MDEIRSFLKIGEFEQQGDTRVQPSSSSTAPETRSLWQRNKASTLLTVPSSSEDSRMRLAITTRSKEADRTRFWHWSGRLCRMEREEREKAERGRKNSKCLFSPGVSLDSLGLELSLFHRRWRACSEQQSGSEKIA
jgi:hypothetical protein